MPDRVHEVRFAEPHAAVDEQRVIGGAGVLRDSLRRGVREMVRRADNKAVERVFRVQRIDVDRLAVLGRDIFVVILRQHEQNVLDCGIRLFRRVHEIVEIEVAQRFENVARRDLQHKNAVLDHERHDHVDPGMEAQTGHLRPYVFARFRPYLSQVIHVRIPPPFHLSIITNPARFIKRCVAPTFSRIILQQKSEKRR